MYLTNLTIVGRCGVARACMLLSFLLIFPVFASSVEEVDLPEISRNAALIFEGQVVGKEVRRHVDDGRPMTYFTFRVDDVVKGHYHHETIELGFEGGTIDGLTAMVSDLEMPVMGEQGIYFVESLERQLVHPLYGWNQGHYLIQTDAGGTRRVKRVKSEAVVPKAKAPGEVLELDVLFSYPPSLSDFKRHIRDNL